jgi:hypothetical protein
MHVGDFLVDTAEVDPAWLEIVAPCYARPGWEPAPLTFDSWMEQVHVMRAESGHARVLIFTATALSLELELMADRVVGQIVPPGPGEVVVETPDGGSFRIEADDMGFFDFEGMPRGQVRLRCETAAGRLVTDWVGL